MALTSAQIVALAGQVARGEVMPDDAAEMAGDQWHEVMAFIQYAIGAVLLDGRRRKLRLAQRRATRLLRDFLTPDQAAELRRNGYFHATMPSGRTYRLFPRFGHVERVERHGKRWFREGRYCYHEDRDRIEGIVDLERQPLADRTVGQLLLLLADEERFLAEANWTPARHEWWNGDWRRRVRNASRQREHGCDTCHVVGHNDAAHDDWARRSEMAGHPLDAREYTIAWIRETEIGPLFNLHEAREAVVQ